MEQNSLVIVQNPDYPACKKDIWEVELLPTLYPRGYRIGKTDSKLFLIRRDKTLTQGSFAILDRRSYREGNFEEKFKQLLSVMKL